MEDEDKISAEKELLEAKLGILESQIANLHVKAFMDQALFDVLKEITAQANWTINEDHPEGVRLEAGEIEFSDSAEKKIAMLLREAQKRDPNITEEQMMSNILNLLITAGAENMKPEDLFKKPK